MRKVRYRHRIPSLLRRLLYFDAFDLNGLASRGIRVQHDVTLSGDCLATPQAPQLGVWPDAQYAAKPDFQMPAARGARLQGVFYNPWFNLITDRTGAVLRESTGTVLPIDHRALSRRLSGTAHELQGTCAIFRSVHNNFYHTLIDNLSRMYLLHQPCYRGLPEVKLLLPGPPTEQERYLFERYLPENVVVTEVPVDRYIHPETLIFSSFLTRRSVACLPSHYLRHMQKRFLPTRPRQRLHRILIERIPGDRGRLRVIENQDELTNALKPFGFEAYRLEELSFDEQIALFYNAETVVAPHGAGLSNLIFGNELDVIELHASPMVIPNFYYIAMSMGHRYRYWKGEESHFENSFAVNIDEVLQLLPHHILKSPYRGG